ncbi:MAG: ABC transporter permease [Ilumatobacteraceae bacterium]
MNALWRTKARRALLVGGVLFLVLSFVRAITDTDSLTSSGTMGSTLRLTVPILLAGLAGLWAERVGVVNIGIEGMMILGTWFGGFAAWQWGAWAGLAFGILGGVIGGLIHAVAVVRFNVDHIISGVALNILAFGAMRYLSELAFVGEQGGGISQSPQQISRIGRLTLPFLAGGRLGDWRSPDILGWLEERHWFVIGDAAGLLRGLVYDVSWATIIALLLVPATFWILWRTRFGLRVRSSGEAPAAAETLGVRVVPLRYTALAISGGFAGLGGAYLAVVFSSYYREGQTASRGYIGLATMIFGNWRPSGVLGGAALFGFGDALQLVARDALPKLFLFFAIIATAIAVITVLRRRIGAFIASASFAVLFGVAFAFVEEVPEPLTKAVPYLLTIIVLATASQRLRPPAHAGRSFRSGESR